MDVDHLPKKLCDGDASSGLRRAFYRVSEACTLLSVGRTQLYQLIQAHKIPVVKFGRSTRIAATALEAFIEAKTLEAQQGLAEHEREGR